MCRSTFIDVCLASDYMHGMGEYSTEYWLGHMAFVF
jgi:hypothetical protein